jgi:hypothetical protein
VPRDFTTIADLARLPVLDRSEFRTSLEARTSRAGPSVAVEKTTTESTGQPAVVRYSLESRYWRRDRYLDASPRDDASLARAAAELARYAPQVIIGFASGTAALARFVVERRLRTWRSIPVSREPSDCSSTIARRSRRRSARCSIRMAVVR